MKHRLCIRGFLHAALHCMQVRPELPDAADPASEAAVSDRKELPVTAELLHQSPDRRPLFPLLFLRNDAVLLQKALPQVL